MSDHHAFVGRADQSEMVLAQPLRRRTVRSVELHGMELALELIFYLLRLRQTGGTARTLIKVLLDNRVSLTIERS